MAVRLIRHTTPRVAPGTCYGRTDLPLADSFAVEAAEVLRALGPMTVLVTSPLGRCRALAAHLAGHHGQSETVSDAFIEMDFGRWEGTPWGRISRTELDAWAADFKDYSGHGGESVAQLEARVREGLATLPRGAVVVTHAGVIKAAMAICGQGDGWDHQTPFGGIETLVL